jgi:hypothetical protein
MAITFKQSEYLLFPQYQDCMTLTPVTRPWMSALITVSVNINLFWHFNLIIQVNNILSSKSVNICPEQ